MNTNVTSLLKKLLVLSLAVATVAPLCAMYDGGGGGGGGAGLDQCGRTALHRAAALGHTDAVRALLEDGADMDAVDKLGRTALHLAAWLGHIDTVRALLDAMRVLLEDGADMEDGAGMNAADKCGMTAFHYAAMKGYKDIMRLLLEYGVNASIECRRGYTAVDWAVAHRVSSRDSAEFIIIRPCGARDASGDAAAPE